MNILEFVPALLPAFIYLFIFETGSLYGTQAGLELSILLPQPPKCWDNRCEPASLPFSLPFLKAYSFSIYVHFSSPVSPFRAD
jgi:hypothetical protein